MDLDVLVAHAQVPGARLDSSMLRGSSLRRLATEGLIRIDRYNHTAGYLVAPSVIDDLAAATRRASSLAEELAKARPLITAALSLGLAPAETVGALLPSDGDTARIDVRALGELIAGRIDELDAAAIASERYRPDSSADVPLTDFISSLGLNEAELRTAIDAGDTLYVSAET